MSSSLKVLVALPRFGKGGAEKLACDTAIEMQKRPGVQVKVVSFDTENQYPNLTSLIDVQWIPSKIYLSPYKKNRFELTAYSNFVKQFQPDIIHSHLFEAEIISRSIDYPQAKYFSHCHDNMHQLATFQPGTLLNKVKLIEYYERSYLFNRYRKNGGNRFVAISKDTYKYFSEVLPADLRNITLLLNAINFHQYNAANNQRDLNTIKLVNTGSFVPKKNQQFLLEVLKVLKQRGKQATLTLLGSGPQLQQVKDKAQEYGLSGNIVFVGNVERVEDHLKEANVYVHSAYYEPFGLVLIEAMAAGLPVVSLDGRGNRELVIDGENGFFIPEQNAEQFADKIIALTSNEAAYRKISANAIAFARKFDMKEYVDRMLELYSRSLV